MDWTHFRTYGDSYNQAFETLCNQLFERYLRRTYPDLLLKFRALNGAGGDGGIEAYGQLRDASLNVIQSKWFPDNIGDAQIAQIRHSVTTAMAIRPAITQYYICVPRNLNSTTFRRGPKGEGPRPAVNTEERRVDDLTDELHTQYPGLTITWWFEHDLALQLQEQDNDGVFRFWFDTELVSFQHLKNQFDLQRAGWLQSRYIPDLHGQGIIQKNVQQVLYNRLFRERLVKTLDSKLLPLVTLHSLIPKFLETLPGNNPLRVPLTEIRTWIEPWISLARATVTSIEQGQSDLNIRPLPQPPIADTFLNTLAGLTPTGVQKNSYQHLLDALFDLRNIDFNKVLADIQEEAAQIGRLFLGNSGTGKTHGLANAIDQQLTSGAPGIIIRAKGTSCQSWTEILAQALDTPGWNRNQMLSALESLATRQDNRVAGLLPPFTDPQQEPTKVVICIDGLEEDTLHWSDWYDRMRETIPLTTQYQRIRFVFSARPYYYDETKTPNTPLFQVVTLPQEGDVPVYQVMGQYFAPEHFNITVDPTLIRGLDTLFALRLFCDEYKGRTLTSTDQIDTAEKVLLNKKVERMNREFMESLGPIVGQSRKPVLDALQTIADGFYDKTDIEMPELFAMVTGATGTYLNQNQVDRLIDYLVNNGVLIRADLPGTGSILGTTRSVFSLSQQSILELIISDKLVRDIQGGVIERIPEKFVVAPAPTADTQAEFERFQTQRFVDQRIINNTVKALFYDHGKLIGEGQFMVQGLNASAVAFYQMAALADAPKSIDPKYGERVRQSFAGDAQLRYQMFGNILFPAAASSANYFGADFLHDILNSAGSAFARERLWLGWDSVTTTEFERRTNKKFYNYDLQAVIDPDGAEFLELSPHDLHNEYPLVFGWALSTLDQRLRHKLRVALTGWALKQPAEYILLLNKLFNCNDPQIQEDLASISLGLAGKLKDQSAIESIARWALQNVFSDLERNRNVIVREGFRSIVERALQFGLISEEEARQARPRPMPGSPLLPLDDAAHQQRHEEIYPIVHDLAWYVIKDAYDDFLDYPTEIEPEDNPAPDSVFLRAYAREGIADGLGPHSWAMAAAIYYIKSLGFDRTDGNGFTKATHGSKSDVYTLEEKYTWLAVHYLMGYISDLVPLKDEGRFINSYLEIVDVPNPADFLPEPGDEVTQPFVLKKQWVIQEELIPELNGDAPFEQAIREAVHREPVIDFKNWLIFDSQAFTDSIPNQKLLSLNHYTVLHDPKQYVVARIDARGIIVKKGQVPVITDLILHHPGRSYFAQYIDGMHASPATDIYSNPSDVTWMNWIAETKSSENYYPSADNEEAIYCSVVSVTNNTIRGEQEVKIPSKLARQLTNIVELDNGIFLNPTGQFCGLMHEIQTDQHEQQELLLVKEIEWLQALEAAGYEMIWFVEVLHRKNALNDKIKSDQFPQKVRKYLVYYDAGEIKAVKYWDARFSNAPDR